MADAHTLHEIRLFKRVTSNNWEVLQVVSVNDESFKIQTAHEILTFKDEDFENTQGKIIIDLKSLDLGRYYGEAVIPTEFELPREILTERVEYRRLNALASGALFIDRIVDPIRYFYIDGGRLRIKQGAKEVTVDKIEKIYGKKAVNVDGLDWHPYLELPTTVVCPFEETIRKNELKRLSLVLRGKSLLDGWDYYGFSVEPSEDQWTWVKKYFVEFGTDDKTLNGWLTWNPQVVADILGIPIEAGL